MRSRKPCASTGKEDGCQGEERTSPGFEKGTVKNRTGQCAQNEFTEQEVKGWEVPGSWDFILEAKGSHQNIYSRGMT